MAESKFTKGPWGFQESEAYKNTWRVTADGQRLASLNGDDGDPEETKANAELMADAPSMLEVLRTLCESTVAAPEDVRVATKAFADAERLLEKHGG
jgi:hypothetical protein